MAAELLEQYHKAEVFKLGDFVLKSGLKSSIYIDLRMLISDIKLMAQTGDELVKIIQEKKLEYDYIVGVPYAALPIATAVALQLEAPMLLKRKEAKSYGTKKLIEGIYESGKKALIIEDVVTSGASILETVASLREEGLVCVDVICALDREQGGVEKLKKERIQLHSAVSMTRILEYLVASSIITNEKREDIKKQLDEGMNLINSGVDINEMQWTLENRKNLLKDNALNKALLEIILAKKTNLCVAVDESDKTKVLSTIQSIGKCVCAIKLHADIVNDFDAEFSSKLQQLAKELNFVLFADRKLADIGNTVESQLTEGVFKYSKWANVVTVHSVPGKAILKSIGNVISGADSTLKGALLIASLSSEGALTDAEYSKKTVAMAKDSKDVVSGFICQKRCGGDASFLYWTPGVNEAQKTDGKGQQWRSIEDAIQRDGNDIIIVGRAITQSADAEKTAQEYATKAFGLWSSR